MSAVGVIAMSLSLAVSVSLTPALVRARLRTLPRVVRGGSPVSSRMTFVQRSLAMTAASAPGARRRTAALHRRSVVEFVDVLAADLAVGRPMHLAVLAAADESAPSTSLLAEVASAAAAHADVAGALDSASRADGAEALARVAVCWRVAERHGASLSAALVRVADGLRADDDVRREVRTQLSGPRATVRLLAALPFVGLLMGGALDAHPLATAFGTWPGRVCVVVGALLCTTGLLWVERLASAVERGSA
jgi:tight adherence protein B